MSNQPRRCPVCRREVVPTRDKNICGHLDKNRQPCPGSYRIPFDLAISLDDHPTPNELAAVLAQIHELSKRR